MSYRNIKLTVLAALLLGSSTIAVEAEAKESRLTRIMNHHATNQRRAVNPFRLQTDSKNLRLQAVDVSLYKILFESHELLSRTLSTKNFEVLHYSFSSAAFSSPLDGIKSTGMSGKEIAQLMQLQNTSETLASQRLLHNQQLAQEDALKTQLTEPTQTPIHAPISTSKIEVLTPHYSDKKNIGLSSQDQITPIEQPQEHSLPQSEETLPHVTSSEPVLTPVKKVGIQNQEIVQPPEISPLFEPEEQGLRHVATNISVPPKAPPAPPLPPAGRLVLNKMGQGNANLLKGIQNRKLNKVDDLRPKGASHDLQNQLLAELMGGRKPRNATRIENQGTVDPNPDSVGFRFNLKKVNAQDQNRFAKRLNGEVFEDENTSSDQSPFGKRGKNKPNARHVDAQDVIREAAFKRPQLRKVAEEDKNKFKRDLQENPQDHGDVVVGMMIGDSATVNKKALAQHAIGNHQVMQAVKYQRPQLRKVNPDEQNKFAKQVIEKKLANAGQTLAENVVAVQINDSGSGVVKNRAEHARKAVHVLGDIKGGFDLRALLRPTFPKPKDLVEEVPSQQPTTQVSDVIDVGLNTSANSSALTLPQKSSDHQSQDVLVSSVTVENNVVDEPLIQPNTVISSILPLQNLDQDLPQVSPQTSTIPTPPTMSPPKMLMGKRPISSAPKNDGKKKKSFILVTLSADVGNKDNLNRMTHHNTSADVMEDLISDNPLARLKKTNTVASQEREQAILREQENALQQQAAMRKIELQHQARLERERLERERKAEEERLVQLRYQQQKALAVTAPKSSPGSDSILDMIKRGRSDDGSSVGFGLRKVKDLPTQQSAKPKKTLQELQEDPTAAQEDLLKAALGARFGAIHGQDDEEDDDTWDDF